jgi:hypothetical protein
MEEIQRRQAERLRAGAPRPYRPKSASVDGVDWARLGAVLVALIES